VRLEGRVTHLGKMRRAVLAEDCLNILNLDGTTRIEAPLKNQVKLHDAEEYGPGCPPPAVSAQRPFAPVHLVRPLRASPPLQVVQSYRSESALLGFIVKVGTQTLALDAGGEADLRCVSSTTKGLPEARVHTFSMTLRSSVITFALKG
jgi:hypothetical protein